MMRYYLKIVRPALYSQSERYTNIDLSKIDKKLITDNNLHALATFTMTFDDSRSFKEFLIASGLIDKKQSYFDLKFTYVYKKYEYELDIPFKYHEKYFDLVYLSDQLIEKNNMSKNDLITNFLHYYQNKPELRNFCDEVKKYSSGGFSKGQLQTVIMDLFDNICKKNNKRSFRRKFDLVMYVCKLLKVEKVLEPKIPENNKIEQIPDLDDYEQMRLY